MLSGEEGPGQVGYGKARNLLYSTFGESSD